MEIIEVHNQKQLNDALKVRTSVFVDEQKVPEDIEKDQFDAQAVHFVGYISNQAVAAGRCRINTTHAKLERICVIEAFRGQSLGKELILHMEQSLIKKGVKKVALGSQTHATSFYLKLGYQTVSSVFIDANMPHVMMEKALFS
ncbi:putative N-acetyltransferase YjcF [Paraliobacillus sp. PM-2]|uniref:GNAT family N-acetyltransferase n=1 Tax=Paraliobacillus sp. PM-2 TaxID=1462524 RepID=UPI00061BB841|nr:GNAT family N-acetyltransferase [Paraliobacillus sp. PM-2]CQR47978.1 putative N-acetyltransferase YjcF [Paraliobacillus sp. PM-2]